MGLTVIEGEANYMLLKSLEIKHTSDQQAIEEQRRRTKLRPNPFRTSLRRRSTNTIKHWCRILECIREKSKIFSSIRVGDDFHIRSSNEPYVDPAVPVERSGILRREEYLRWASGVWISRRKRRPCLHWKHGDFKMMDEIYPPCK